MSKASFVCLTLEPELKGTFNFSTKVQCPLISFENSETFKDLMNIVQAAVGETANLLSASPQQFSDATKST